MCVCVTKELQVPVVPFSNSGAAVRFALFVLLFVLQLERMPVVL